MQKILIKLGSIALGTVAPLAIVISCSNRQYILETNKFQGLFLDPQYQSHSLRAHIIMSNIQREKIKTYNSDLSSSFGVPLISGGYGDARHFYSKKQNSLSLHLGDDVFVKSGTQIFAPYKGEVVAAWGKSQVGEIGGGLGGQVIMRVKVSDMNISNSVAKELKNETFVYISFGHLSLSSTGIFPNTSSEKQHIDATKFHQGIWNWQYNINIDFKHPYKVQKGQVIGEIGTLKENGGWIPHVHVEVRKGSAKRNNSFSKYIMESGWNNIEFMTEKWKVFNNIKGIGVFTSSVSPSKEWLLAHFQGGSYKYKNTVKKIDYKNSLKYKYGFIDPNELFYLWNKHSKIITLE